MMGGRHGDDSICYSDPKYSTGNPNKKCHISNNRGFIVFLDIGVI